MLRKVVLVGAKDGIKTSISLLALMVPISLGITLLDYSGALAFISQWIAPVFKYMGLPGPAAFAFITGALVNCYSAIAIMITLPLSGREITILSLLVLLAHNLPVEVSVQKKAGSSAVFITILRVGAALAAGVALNFLLPAEESIASDAPAAAAVQAGPLSRVFLDWVYGSFLMIIKVLLIIVGLMIMNRFLEETRIVEKVSGVVYPRLFVLGLSRQSAFLWIISNTLGLAYGAGVILAQKRENKISDKDIRELNVSMATCHSILEDTLLFVAIGASLFWVVAPRFLIAAIGVWAYRFIIRLLQGRQNGRPPETAA